MNCPECGDTQRIRVMWGGIPMFTECPACVGVPYKPDGFLRAEPITEHHRTAPWRVADVPDEYDALLAAEHDPEEDRG